MRFDLAFHLADIEHGLRERAVRRRRSDREHGEVQAGDAGIDRLLHEIRGERAVGLGVAEAAQAVDHDGLTIRVAFGGERRLAERIGDGGSSGAGDEAAASQCDHVKKSLISIRMASQSGISGPSIQSHCESQTATTLMPTVSGKPTRRKSPKVYCPGLRIS